MSDATSEDLPSEREFAQRAQPGTFSHEHLQHVAERLITRFPDIVSSAGIADDASGVEVTLLRTPRRATTRGGVPSSVSVRS